MYLIEYLGSSRGKPSYIDPIEVLIVFPKLEFQSDSGITTVTWFRLPLDSGTNAWDLSIFELQEAITLRNNKMALFFIAFL
tara:strand:- start:97 stop:339 length:243 start_codon:yes stop_codon:yes gene_type:complete